MTAVTTDVLIVGAGFYGLSSAWWMKRLRSSARIMVVDEGEFASGASGRNGAGFRMQWGLDLNILLSKESTAFFENAAELLDYPRGIELKQDGYWYWRQPECAGQAQREHRDPASVSGAE
jgi:sarcosine oxidase subunit beta